MATLAQYRLIPIALLSASVLTILMGGVLRVVLPGAYDPWPARIGIAVLCLVVAALARSRRTSRVWVDAAMQGIATLATAWVGLLLWGNGFPASGSSGIFVVQAACLASFPNVRSGAAHVAAFVSMILIAGAFTPEPEVAPLGLAATALAVGSLVLAGHAQRAGLSRALRKSRDSLEADVRARTAALETEVRDRRVAELHALQASRAKSRFLANMSHELRTPLNAILGYTSLLQEEAEPDTPMQEDLQRISGAGQHLLGLVNDVLDLSRIEAGAITMSPETVAVGPLLEGIAADLGPVAAARNNHIEVDAGEWIELVTDRQRASQVLMNLVSNAIKFTEGGTITLRARPQGAGFALQVQDDGIGIPAQALPELFERFTQVDDSPTRTRDGAGLGLALSRDLARHLGGDLIAQSEEGKGSTFTLLLPVATPPLADPLTEPACQRAAAPT